VQILNGPATVTGKPEQKPLFSALFKPERGTGRRSMVMIWESGDLPVCDAELTFEGKGDTLWPLSFSRV